MKPLNTQPAFGRFSISPKRWNRLRNSRIPVVATPNWRASSSSLMAVPGRVLSRSIHSMKLSRPARTPERSPPREIAAFACEVDEPCADVRVPRHDAPRGEVATTLRTVVRLTPSVADKSFSDGTRLAVSELGDQIEGVVEGALEHGVRLHAARILYVHLVHKKQFDQSCDEWSFYGEETVRAKGFSASNEHDKRRISSQAIVAALGLAARRN